MAINYNTENFANISKDVNTLLAQGFLRPEKMADYLKEVHDVEEDEWNEAVSEALKAEKLYFQQKKLHIDDPWSLAWIEMPAHLRETEATTLRSVLEFPMRSVTAGIRGSAEGITQLVGMGLESVAPEVDKTISDEMKDFDDYLSKNKLTRPVWNSLKQTFDPATSTAEEITGLIGSLGVGTIGATSKIAKLLPKLGGVTQRTAGFVAADLLLSDKNENLAKFLVTQFPETAAPLEILAIDENDPGAIKLLKKAVEAAALGVATEGIIAGAIKGYKGIKGKIKARNEDILKAPKDDAGSIVETKIVRRPEGDFEQRVRMEQPVKILREDLEGKVPGWWTKIVGDPKVGKEGGLFGKWVGSRQGLDDVTFRAVELKSSRATEAEAILKNQSTLFERSLERSYGKKLKDFTDDEIAILNEALGKSLGTDKGVLSQEIKYILSKKPAQRTHREKAQLAEYRKARFDKSRYKRGILTKEIQYILNKKPAQRTHREKAELKTYLKAQEDLSKLKAEAGDEQAAALAKLPEDVQQQIVNMRGMVDDYTQVIIKEGIPGKDLVPRLDHNLGFYISTDYELFSNPLWLKSVKRVLNAERTSPDLRRKHLERVYGKKVTEKEADDLSLKAAQRTLERIHGKKYTTEEIAQHLSKATDEEALRAINSARKWYKINIKDSEGNRLSDHMVDVHLRRFIADINKGDTDFLATVVPGSSSPLKSHKLGKILTKREHIPPELHPLLREVTDPAQRFRSTIRKQARVLAEHEFANTLKTISETPYGKHLFHMEKAGVNTPNQFTGRLSDIANNYLKSVGSNPLANVMTTPSFLKTLTRVLKEGENPTGLWGAAYRANAVAAGMKTIMSHPTHLINIQGNILFSMANGNFLPTTLLRGGEHWKAAGSTIGALTRKQPGMNRLIPLKEGKAAINRKEYEELQALGLLDSGVSQEYFLRAFDKMDSIYEEGAKGLSKWFGKGYRGIGRAYRAEDGIFKAYNYYAELARYRKAFPDMPEPELKLFAAERVKDTLPTYGRIPMGIKKARKSFPITAFPSFLTESIRVSKNVFKYGITDFAEGAMTGNLQLMRIGAERLAGATGAALVGSEFLLGSRAENGITADDEDFIEMTAPIYDKHSQRYWTSPARKNPKFNNHIQASYVNLSRNDPFDAIKQIGYSTFDHAIIPLIQAARGKITWEQAKEEALQWIEEMKVVGQPILTPNLIAQGIVEHATGWPKERKKDPQDTWPEYFGEMVAETYEPGSVKAFRKPMEAAESARIHSERLGKSTTGQTRVGFPDNADQRFYRHMGVGVHTFDFNKSLQYATARKVGEIKDSQRNLANLITGEMGQGAAGYDWNNPENLKKFYSEVDKVIVDSYKAQRDLAKILRQASKFSYEEVAKDRVIRRTVGDEQVRDIVAHQGMKKIDKHFDFAVVDGIMRGRVGVFNPPTLPENFIDNLKVRKQNIPVRIIEDVTNYINEHFRNSPLLASEEEE